MTRESDVTGRASLSRSSRDRADGPEVAIMHCLPRRPRGPMDLSVVVPVFNEQDNVAPLAAEVRASVRDLSSTWELLFVDDGSADATPEVVDRLASEDPRIRLVQLNRNAGQTAAMMAGFHHARGDVIVTMDGDLQNDPRDIPALLATLEQGFDLVAGWRRRRQDKVLTRKVPSWIANRIIAWITGIPIKDNGCSLKAYRRALLADLVLYSDMHRFIPALAALRGARIAQLPVRHHARRFGTSKYGLGRTYRVLADLVTIKMLIGFRDRPLLGFAAAAVIPLLLAILFGGAWLVAYTQFHVEKAQALVFPGAAFVWLFTAVFLIILGLVAESVVRQRAPRISRTVPLVREFHGSVDQT